MAMKTKKDKPKKVAIGDQILLEVARWHIAQGVACSLHEFKVEHEIRIGALVAYGFLYKTDTGKYLLTEVGRTYVRKQFPERFK